MTESIKYLEPSHVPALSHEICVNDAAEVLIPKGFNDIVSAKATFDGVKLSFNNAEKVNQDIVIPASIFSPETHGVLFPKFILQISTFMSKKVDYSQYPGLILNQNQLLYLILHHRFTQFSQNRVHYTYLLREDISHLNNYGEYVTNCTANSLKKTQNSCAILSPWTRYGSKIFLESPIGEHVKPITYTHSELHAIFRDLDIQPSSESMASETSKVVVYPYEQALYSSAGFESKDGKIRSIFPAKSNLPARIKTHIISDAYKVRDQDKTIFTEDFIDSEGNNDGTLINAVVLFEEIDDEGRFACGEIESSLDFASNDVYKDEVIRQKFEAILIKEGMTLRPTKNKFILGMNQEGEEVALYNFDSVDITKVIEIGMSGAYKIIAHCTRKIGSARIFSHTGLKGVTKVKPNLGHIEVQGFDGDMVTMDVDLIAGPNSIKAKENTIFLAKAALSHLLGFSDSEYISSMDENEINSLVKLLPTVTYVDTDGNRKEAHAGIIPVCVNELAYMFNNVKNQSFMAESGRFLKHGGHEDIFDHIWNTGLDPDKLKAVEELQRILCDDIGKYAIDEKIPVYTPKQLKDHKIFSEDDLKTNMNPLIKYSSKMLDEEYNKGWYLDLRYRNGGLLRMPSAKLINLFVSQLPNGSWVYPRLFQLSCNIVGTCIIPDSKTGRFNIGFLNDKNTPREVNSFEIKSTKSLSDQYLQTIRGILHSRLNIAQTLSKPKITGIGMKQMTDSLVPIGTVVILDNHAYEKLAKKGGEFYEETGYFRALCIRNPVVWKSQIQSLQVWNSEMFSDYLRIEYGVDIKEYISIKHCKELLFMNPDDAILQQSDVDGDLMPVFVPEGAHIHRKLELFRQIHDSDFCGVDGVTEQELEWIMNYRADELQNNDILHINSDDKYIIYEVPFKANAETNNCFENYFIDAIIAKGDVGIATFNLWALQCLLEIFKKICDKGEKIPNLDMVIKFSDDDLNTISYFYSRLVQDFVIRGIKWNEGGSSGFYPFLLSNIIDPENREMAYAFLHREVKIQRATLDKFFMMIAWAEDIGLLRTIMQFLSLYNSGKLPKTDLNEENVQLILDTYTGKLVRPLYDIRNYINEARNSGFNFDPRMYKLDSEEIQKLHSERTVFDDIFSSPIMESGEEPQNASMDPFDFSNLSKVMDCDEEVKRSA